MNSVYDKIVHFMEEYFQTYTQYGQDDETYRRMDKFYAPELSFPDDGVIGRDQWYERCLSHPEIQDKLTKQHLYIDEKQKEVGALLKTQAIERSSGKILLELKMNVFYKIKFDNDCSDIKITEVRVFLESDPVKVSRLNQLYKIR